MSEPQVWTLSMDEFWRLVARMRLVDLRRAELRAIIAERQGSLDAAIAEARTEFRTVAEAYGFDPDAEYRFDEKAIALVKIETESESQAV